MPYDPAATIADVRDRVAALLAEYAELLVRRPSAVLLDEPANRLSPALCDELEEALRTSPGAIAAPRTTGGCANAGPGSRGNRRRPSRYAVRVIVAGPASGSRPRLRPPGGMLRCEGNHR